MSDKEISAALDYLQFKTGKGNWQGFQLSIDTIRQAAEEWATITKGHDKLWLCWNVDPEWNLVQQRLALKMGWTPLVGSDPRAKEPTILPGSLHIDFNEKLQLPMIHMLFAVEFAFLYVPNKLAFWHSDLLVNERKLRRHVETMESLAPGDMLVTIPGRGRKQRLLGGQIRYWELLACTTREASEHQFLNGAGWFANISHHPMLPQGDLKRRSNLYYDHGAGIHYWAKQYKPASSVVHTIEERELDEGHCSRIRKPDYKLASQDNATRDLTSELSLNYDLHTECKKLGLSAFIGAPRD